MRTKRVEPKYKESTVQRVLFKITKGAIHVLTYVTGGIMLFTMLLFIVLNALQLNYYIDEKFHIPQTMQYCKGNLFKWDPKITTLPGLYLFTALLLGPLDFCTVTYIRFINLVCTYANFYLILEIVDVLNLAKKIVIEKPLVTQSLYLLAWNITYFPPLFFWFFLFYTDVFSTTLVLSMLLLHVYNWNKMSAFMGALSICVRQTNVVWVAFLGMERGLTLVEEITKKPHYTDSLNIIPCVKTFYYIARAKARNGIWHAIKFFLIGFVPILPYMLVLILFVIFVIVNGGIVVGDKSAHVPTFHFTQIFYYSVFSFCFSWPYLIPYFIQFLKFIRSHIIGSIFFICFIALVVHFNTLVHPYVLADNRHYSFYIWKNFMNRYVFFKYLLIPVYAFTIFAHLKSLNHLRILSIAVYVVCICLVLVPQLLLEPRYYIIPYILFRLHQKGPKKWQIIAETITTIFINLAQFLIFTQKSFAWKDEDFPQRIAW